MRTFQLVRDEDPTKIVAEGVQLSNGRVLLAFDSIQEIEEIRATRIVWGDASTPQPDVSVAANPPPPPRPKREPEPEWVVIG